MCSTGKEHCIHIHFIKGYKLGVLLSISCFNTAWCSFNNLSEYIWPYNFRPHASDHCCLVIVTSCSYSSFSVGMDVCRRQWRPNKPISRVESLQTNRDMTATVYFYAMLILTHRLFCFLHFWSGAFGFSAVPGYGCYALNEQLRFLNCIWPRPGQANSIISSHSSAVFRQAGHFPIISGFLLLFLHSALSRC